MGWLLPVRTAHVCCASGPRRGGELEVRLGPAASREGPAGYKGVERAWAAAPRDPTAAGCAGPQPGDDGEFGAATLVNVHRNNQSHTRQKPHLALAVLPNVYPPFAWHIIAREQRGEKSKRAQCACPCRPVFSFLLFPLPSFYCFSQKCRILKDLTLQYLLFPPTPNIAISSSNWTNDPNSASSATLGPHPVSTHCPNHLALPHCSAHSLWGVGFPDSCRDNRRGGNEDYPTASLHTGLWICYVSSCVCVPLWPTLQLFPSTKLAGKMWYLQIDWIVLKLGDQSVPLTRALNKAMQLICVSRLRLRTVATITSSRIQLQAESLLASDTVTDVPWRFFRRLLYLATPRKPSQCLEYGQDESLPLFGCLQSGTIVTSHGGCHADNLLTVLMCCLHGVKLDDNYFQPLQVIPNFRQPIWNGVFTQCSFNQVGI